MIFKSKSHFYRATTNNLRIAKMVMGTIAAIGTCVGLTAYASNNISGDPTDNDIVSEEPVVTNLVTTTSKIPEITTSLTTTSLTTTTTTTTSKVMTETTTTVLTTEVTVIQTTEPIVEEIETVEVDTYVEDVQPYVVYKPSTSYVHMSTCRWFDDSCYAIESTEDLMDVRRCSECNPDIEIVNEYVAPEPVVYTPSTSGSYDMTYYGYFSRGTYYTAYTGACGGSGRTLIDCSWGDGTCKGSIASRLLWSTYGYSYNGKRTMVYLEVAGYPSMNGYYWLDDADAGNPQVIDFYYQYGSNCQFQQAGVVGVDLWIVNY